MVRSSNPWIARRNAQLIERYKNDETLSLPALAAEFGMSRSNVAQILKQHDVPIRRNVPRQPKHNKVTIDSYSSRITLRLNDYLYQSGYSNTPKELSALLGVSRVRAGEMLRGQHDWTLNELIKVSQLIKTPVEDLIKPKEASN